METRFLGSGDVSNPSGGLCDEYRLSGIDDLGALLAAASAIAAHHAGCRPLLSLDDFRQARYTSGHAIGNLDLDDVGGADLAGLPPECFENGQHRGYLATKAEFPIRARNVARLAENATFAEACRFGLSLDQDALAEWFAFQDDPVSLLDQPVSVLIVPAEHGDEALAAFPNGYFTSDLSPALNAAVARHFRQAHGYDLIGIGAAYLGLVRPAPADGSALAAIAADFRALYNMDDALWTELEPHVTAAIGGRVHLWLRYTE